LAVDRIILRRDIGPDMEGKIVKWIRTKLGRDKADAVVSACKGARRKLGDPPICQVYYAAYTILELTPELHEKEPEDLKKELTNAFTTRPIRAVGRKETQERGVAPKDAGPKGKTPELKRPVRPNGPKQ
jgi:hypothetical protein